MPGGSTVRCRSCAPKMLAEMQSGQVVRVVATDPGSVKDFQAFARQTGNELVQQGETADKAFEFLPEAQVNVPRPQSSR